MRGKSLPLSQSQQWGRWLTALCCLLLARTALADPAVLDARLTDFAYPYPVKTLTLADQQQSLEMAYMDVKPEQANGQTVLLLHGKNFSGAYWKTTMDVLLKQGYRVVVPDQIGFGKSSKPAHFQYSFQVLADQTRRLLDTLKVARHGGWPFHGRHVGHPVCVDVSATQRRIGVSESHRSGRLAPGGALAIGGCLVSG